MSVRAVLGAGLIFGLGCALGGWLGSRALVTVQGGAVVAARPATRGHEADAEVLGRQRARLAQLEQRIAAIELERPARSEPVRVDASPEELLHDDGSAGGRAEVNGAFSGESKDPLWSASQERAIHALFEPSAGDNRLRSVDCRQTLCMLVVELGAERGLEELERTLFRPPFDRGVAYSLSPDGKAATVYTGRGARDLERALRADG